MQNFIVLGIIPGTQYQMTFTLWLYVMTGLLVVALSPHLLKKRYALRLYWAARQIARAINQAEFQLPA